MSNINIQQYYNLRIGTLNCRSLEKHLSPTTLQQFSRFLRSQSIQLYAFQEITQRSFSDTMGSILDLYLQVHSSLWGKYCGIVSMDPALQITPMHHEFESRFLIAKISHIHKLFDPFFLI
ncbi:hypothetical protein BC941DRAFT_361636, partial [Chlamydoabsidia padenii]